MYNMMKSLFTVVLLVVVIPLSLLAEPPAGSELKESQISQKSFDYDSYIDANDILMMVSNVGMLGRDLADLFGNDYGTYWPFTDTTQIYSGANVSSVMYSFGSWIGGMVNGELRVTVAEYSSEYTPGPMANGTYLPDQYAFRVYKLYSDSLESNPNSDYSNWPVDQGAPLDLNGKPEMFGDQMLWTVFNDADPARHRNNNGETAPLGIEIHQRIYAYDISSFSTTIIIEYKLFNKGGVDIDSCHFALWSDPDVGSSMDDMVGCDTVNNIFFAYNSSNNDTKFAYGPPAVGFKLLRGPLVPSHGSTGYFGTTMVVGHKNLGMTAFSRYINGTDPDNAGETWDYMHGLNAKMNGQPYVYMGDTLTYMCTGNPEAGIGDLDYGPDDKRMMATCGPFQFNAGDSQYVAYAMTVGYAPYDRLSSIAIMRYLLGMINFEESCCTGRRGHVDCDGRGFVDMGDLVLMIDHLYLSLNPLCCMEAGNVDGSQGGMMIDSGDLTIFIDHLFLSLQPLILCP